MSKQGQVRIIAGKWKRRIIRFPSEKSLRPTPDAVRETLFNWLREELADSVCLDLFAGSGAIGFEAASRGARKVIMVDKNPRIARALTENCQSLNAADQIEVLNMSADRYLKTTPLKFDLVFLDPPYSSDSLESLCLSLYQSEQLNPGAHIYIESSKSNIPLSIPTTWHIIQEKQCGMVNSRLIKT